MVHTTVTKTATKTDALTEKQKETIRSLIGEGVHTGLRKYCESAQSSAAHQAISDLSDEEWAAAVGMAADAVVDYIESGEDGYITTGEPRR